MRHPTVVNLNCDRTPNRALDGYSELQTLSPLLQQIESGITEIRGRNLNPLLAKRKLLPPGAGTRPKPNRLGEALQTSVGTASRTRIHAHQ